jgi:hypothetical protein
MSLSVTSSTVGGVQSRLLWHVAFCEENPIGERTDGPVTELAEKPELAGHSEGGGEERAPLLYVPANVGAREYIAP